MRDVISEKARAASLSKFRLLVGGRVQQRRQVIQEHIDNKAAFYLKKCK